MREEFGFAPPFTFKAEEVSPERTGLLAPLSAFCIKGWSRSVFLHTILLCGFQEPTLLDEWPKETQKKLVISFRHRLKIWVQIELAVITLASTRV